MTEVIQNGSHRRSSAPRILTTPLRPREPGTVYQRRAPRRDIRDFIERVLTKLVADDSTRLPSGRCWHDHLGMSEPIRIQKQYDHRLRQLIQLTGDLNLAAEYGVRCTPVQASESAYVKRADRQAERWDRQFSAKSELIFGNRDATKGDCHGLVG